VVAPRTPGGELARQLEAGRLQWVWVAADVAQFTGVVHHEDLVRHALHR